MLLTETWICQRMKMDLPKICRVCLKCLSAVHSCRWWNPFALRQLGQYHRPIEVHTYVPYLHPLRQSPHVMDILWAIQFNSKSISRELVSIGRWWIGGWSVVGISLCKRQYIQGPLSRRTACYPTYNKQLVLRASKIALFVEASSSSSLILRWCYIRPNHFKSDFVCRYVDFIGPTLPWGAVLLRCSTKPPYHPWLTTQ